MGQSSCLQRPPPVPVLNEADYTTLPPSQKLFCKYQNL